MAYEMDGRSPDPNEYPEVTFGHGVRIYGSVTIGPGSLIGDYCVLGVPPTDDIEAGEPRSETRIGANVILGPYCLVHNGAEVADHAKLYARSEIGCESVIGPRTRILYGAQVHWAVRIGADCLIAGFCCDRASVGDGCSVFGQLVHKFTKPDSGWDGAEEASPTLGAQVTIGFGAIVVGGVLIGESAYVAAGAVVTKDISPRHIQVGSEILPLADWRARRTNSSLQQ